MSSKLIGIATAGEIMGVVEPAPEVPAVKRCSRCREWKGTGEFSKDKSMSCGLKSWCKLCVHEYGVLHREESRARNARHRELHPNAAREATARYRKRNAESRDHVPEFKTCKTCNEKLGSAEFGLLSGARDGLRSECKRCRADSSRAYRADNGDKIREYWRRWRDANREKTRESGRKHRSGRVSHVLSDLLCRFAEDQRVTPILLEYELTAEDVMGINVKNKGSRHERDIADRLGLIFGEDVRRGWQIGRNHGVPDVATSLISAEGKVGRSWRPYSALAQAHKDCIKGTIPVLVARHDRKYSICFSHSEVYWAMVKALKRYLESATSEQRNEFYSDLDAAVTQAKADSKRDELKKEAA